MKLPLVLAGCFAGAGIIGVSIVFLFKVQPVTLFAVVIAGLSALAALVTLVWGFFQYRSAKRAQKERMLTSGMC